MTTTHFKLEIHRLTLVWPKAFSDGRQKAIWAGLCDLNDNQFSQICDKFVRSLRASPLPDDFIQEARRVQKESFERNLKGACDRIFNWGAQKGLKAYLDKHYPGAETLWDAVTIQRLKLKNGEITAEELLDHGPVDE